MAGIYVHVPFCVRKCFYCDFYSTTLTDYTDAYVSALEAEMPARAYTLQDKEVETIYLGGGTPSLLTISQLSGILNGLRSMYNVLPNAEISIECNPGDVDSLKLNNLLELGINRFSVGVQSFDDKVLQYLGRRHTVDQTHELLGNLRDAGADNISLDLIYSIPGTSVKDLERDLDTLLSYSPEHISTYHLIVEPDTLFGKRKEKGELKEIDEEISLEMSHLISRTLLDNGYEQYEISNYALPGMRSKHNSSYWKGVDYLGLGPGAHSLEGRWRSYNPPDLKGYIRSLTTSGFLIRRYEYRTYQIDLEEYILTSLRTIEGLDKKYLEENYKSDDVTRIMRKLEEYLRQGLIQRIGDRYALTLEGIDVSDGIMASLF